MLIDSLPPESRTKTAIRDAAGPIALAQQAKEGGNAADDGWGPYSNTDMHLGAVIDELRWLAYAIYHAQGAKPKKPKQYPRPGVMPERVKRLNPEGRAYLDRIRERRQLLRGDTSNAPVPEHIAGAAHKRLGPAERQWLTEQLQAMRGTPPPT